MRGVHWISRRSGVPEAMLPPWLVARLEAAGIASAELRSMLDRVGNLDAWRAGWAAIGSGLEQDGRAWAAYHAWTIAQHEALAVAAPDDGVSVALGRAYRAATERHAAPIELAEIEHGGRTFHAYLQVPEGARGAVGAAILVPGFVSVKEDFHDLANELLGRGFAVLRIDQPGYGATPGALRGEFRHQVVSFHRWLATDPRIDAARIHHVGYCFGATMTLSSMQQVTPRSVTMVSTPVRPERLVDGFPEMSRTVAAAVFGAEMRHYEEIPPLFDYMDEDAASLRFDAPALLVHGARDRFVPRDEFDLLCELARGPSRTLVLDDQGHCCRSADDLPALVADWMSLHDAQGQASAAA
jgi:dienelactone hydrolase